MKEHMKEGDNEETTETNTTKNISIYLIISIISIIYLESRHITSLMHTSLIRDFGHSFGQIRHFQKVRLRSDYR